MEELSLRMRSTRSAKQKSKNRMNLRNSDSNIYHHGHVDHIVNRYPKSSRTPYGV